MQFLLDAVAITACTMILVWVIFFNYDMKNAMLMKDDWLSMLIVAMDVLLFVLLNICLLSIKQRRVPIYIQVLSFGILTFIVIDLIYYYEYFYRSYEPNTILDGGYVISFMFIAISGVIKRKYQEINKVTGIVRNKRNLDSTLSNNITSNEKNLSLDHKGNGKILILILAPVLLILFKGIHLNYLFILISIIMFYFIFTNYIQKNIYRDELFRREKMLNIELEHKVEERTRELNELLIRDTVTGLHSRRYFIEQLDKKIDSLVENETLILFYIDLNKYKLIKTMYGNYIGEKILISMGNRLRSAFYDKDNILASYGEDAFVLSMNGNYDYTLGISIADKIIKLTSDIYHIDEYDIRVTINVGISIYPLDAVDRKEIINHADIAMSQVRLEGFNQSKAFDKQLGDKIFEKNRIEMMLKKVQNNEEFCLYYQPQVKAEDGSLIGFEALIRWITKEGQFIPPNVFIPIAEETGFIIPIGNYVMQTAIKQLAIWDKASLLRPRMAINVSVKQLNDRNFIKNLRDLIISNQIQPERIEIEITESVDLEQSKEIKESLEKISKMGISIAIDDFGTGYSSLYYLKNLPINRIKIAKQLIDKIEEDEYDYTIVRTTIHIAKVRDIQVIAEGVETKEQWDCLKKLNCNEIQGYYFAKPMNSKEAFMNWMT